MKFSTIKSTGGICRKKLSQMPAWKKYWTPQISGYGNALESANDTLRTTMNQAVQPEESNE